MPVSLGVVFNQFAPDTAKQGTEFLEEFGPGGVSGFINQVPQNLVTDFATDIGSDLVEKSLVEAADALCPKGNGECTNGQP